MAHTLQGKTHQWQIDNTPIGSGDAGEVYSATSVDQPGLTGVMKMPARIATAGTIQRQAIQIAQECRALIQLDGLPGSKANPPRLLDEAHDFTHGTANYFIVSETAPGEDLATLLMQARQEDKPFPRRVIITILDALFDLFARAHKSGVLWNDIKLEHIYWHNPSGKVGVIDWGNAQFLTHAENPSKPSLPRWEDYRQMVATLGRFLETSAPELYVDLGWEAFEQSDLDLPRISILARRIAYQQQVTAHKVMEYQALIRVILSSEPSLDGLQKIQHYQQNLEIIGAPAKTEEILDYSRALVLSSLQHNDRQTAVRATAMIGDIFGENLGLDWQLTRAYFNQIDLLSHPSLHQLVKNTFHSQWTQALWTIVTMTYGNSLPPWWDRLVLVIRQKALEQGNTPTPLQTGQSLRRWAGNQVEFSPALVGELTKICQNWRMKGTDLLESPFEYELLDFLHREKALPREVTLPIKQSFAIGEAIMRDLRQAWEHRQWDDLQQALMRFITWDPDRWGVIALSEALEKFQIWLDQLEEGPPPGADAQQFIQQVGDERLEIERLLGSPLWLSNLKNFLSGLRDGVALDQFRPEMDQWCPWLHEAVSTHRS